MQFIDTHCHLFWDSFKDDLDEVIANARAGGIRSIIIPATDLKTYEAARDIAARFDDVFLAVGIHPHDSKGLSEELFEQVRAYSHEDKVVAIGEIGLDYYYDYSPKADQHAALRKQLEIAKERDLPVIIHNRESDEDVLKICMEHQDGTLRGQFHCFSSSADYAMKVMEAGFHVSFTGNVTFKKTDLDDALAAVSDDRLLIETDAPFMTPVPHRGKRNEPMYIPLIAEYYAKIRNTTVERIAEITTRNAIALYNLPANIEARNA